MSLILVLLQSMIYVSWFIYHFQSCARVEACRCQHDLATWSCVLRNGEIHSRTVQRAATAVYIQGLFHVSFACFVTLFISIVAFVQITRFCIQVVEMGQAAGFTFVAAIFTHFTLVDRIPHLKRCNLLLSMQMHNVHTL